MTLNFYERKSVKNDYGYKNFEKVIVIPIRIFAETVKEGCFWIMIANHQIKLCSGDRDYTTAPQNYEMSKKEGMEQMKYII